MIFAAFFVKAALESNREISCKAEHIFIAYKQRHVALLKITGYKFNMSSITDFLKLLMFHAMITIIEKLLYCKHKKMEAVQVDNGRKRAHGRNVGNRSSGF